MSLKDTADSIVGMLEEPNFENTDHSFAPYDPHTVFHLLKASGYIKPQDASTFTQEEDLPDEDTLQETLLRSACVCYATQDVFSDTLMDLGVVPSQVDFMHLTELVYTDGDTPESDQNTSLIFKAMRNIGKDAFRAMSGEDCKENEILKDVRASVDKNRNIIPDEARSADLAGSKSAPRSFVSNVAEPLGLL